MPSVRDYKILQRFSGIPISTDVLLTAFKKYAAPHDKIARLVQQGLLLRLRKGLYVATPDGAHQKVSLPLIANHLYGPSYVSLEMALALYGLIPERVFSVYSMTPERSFVLSTPLGLFTYVHCPRAYYSLGITMREEESGTVLIARPEKALADSIVSAKGVRIQSERALRTFLYDDLRVDGDALAELNIELLRQIAQSGYKKKELGYLLKVVENG